LGPQLKNQALQIKKIHNHHLPQVDMCLPVLDVDFDGIIRELNQMGFKGALCVEWEDSGMERMAGAREAYEFVRKINFEPSEVSFDAALKN